MPDDYGIQSVPPRYDEYNSYYVHTSEGYSRAVEEIEAREREAAEAEIKAQSQKIIEEERLRGTYGDIIESPEDEESHIAKSEGLSEEDLRRLEAYNREREREILNEIRMREEEISAQTADISEYVAREETPPGTNLDLLA